MRMVGKKTCFKSILWNVENVSANSSNGMQTEHVSYVSCDMLKSCKVYPEDTFMSSVSYLYLSML